MWKLFSKKTPLEKAADHNQQVGALFAAQKLAAERAQSQSNKGQTKTTNSGAVWDRDKKGPPPWQTGGNVPG